MRDRIARGLEIKPIGAGRVTRSLQVEDVAAERRVVAEVKVGI